MHEGKKTMRKTLLIAAVCLAAACSSNEGQEGVAMQPSVLDLSGYSSEKPAEPVDLLFIHHSTGGHLLAEKGEAVGDNCIYATHPNGGGLRKMLEENNYIVHEASYGSLVGDKTDICHWNAKFRDHMDKVLTCRHQDEFFTDGTKNRIVMFKSCYPNNRIESDGVEPGDPDSCELTTANCKAAYLSLLGYFARQPETLFVVVTAPALVEPSVGIKGFIKSVLRPESSIDRVGIRARNFNNWLKDVENGWLKDYELNNVVVFDYYDILTGSGSSNWSMYPAGPRDSHPNSEGNSLAALEFVPFLNRALHRFGM
jgi:hypothetical protein